MVKPPSGRLVVILHADVVGSTALVQRDERRAHERITDAFRRFSSTIEEYDGQVHEIRGDALVAEFARGSDAICASLRFQRENAARNQTLDDDVTPEVRIGISLGEVVIADGTVTGAGVVLAQRLEQLAEPGGVCLQGATYETVPRRLPFEFRSLGEKHLKGFEEPVRAYAVSVVPGESPPEPERPAAATKRLRTYHFAGGVIALAIIVGMATWLTPWQVAEEETASIEKMAFPLPDKPSIAVLPFTNMSDDPQQEYFVDGMTEDLITDISKLSGLFVIARNTVFTYKGKAVKVGQVAEELGVRYVLEGSVRRAAEQVRISAQLIDATTGGHLWAERYDGSLEDIFALQDRVTQKIVSALSVQLTPAEQDALTRKRQVDTEAYDLLLRGNEHRNRFNAEDNLLAREFYRRAIEVDPAYARAHANLSLTFSNAMEFGWTTDVEGSIRQALESSDTALGLDDSIPQIHFARANVFLNLKRHKAAVDAARRATEVDPSYADGYGMLALCLSYSGELEEALHALNEAKRLNPHASYVFLWLEGQILFLMDRNEQALTLMREAVERNPAFDAGRLLLTAILGHLGLDDAAWEAEEVLAIRPDYSIAIEREQSLYKRPEDLDRYFGGLQRAGLPE